MQSKASLIRLRDESALKLPAEQPTSAFPQTTINASSSNLLQIKLAKINSSSTIEEAEHDLRDGKEPYLQAWPRPVVPGSVHNRFAAHELRRRTKMQTIESENLRLAKALSSAKSTVSIKAFEK